jgi:hypothetical protein
MHNSLATSAFRRLYCAQFTSGSPWLSPSQKAERVRMAVKSRPVLQSPKHRAWWYFPAGDEFWFDCTIGHDLMWIFDGEEVPTRPIEWWAVQMNADRFLVSAGSFLWWNSADRDSFWFSVFMLQHSLCNRAESTIRRPWRSEVTNGVAFR